MKGFVISVCVLAAVSALPTQAENPKSAEAATKTRALSTDSH